MESFRDLKSSKLTPMMKHWYSVKKRYPDNLIAYRMGDFFEFFYDDAVRISKLLGITLTRRTFGGKDSYPLAGIPHHSGNYFKNLVNLGETVVIVEQLEDPADARGRIVKRGIVRIMSPGTIIESDMLKTNENNYISSIVKGKKGYGIAFADLSTGEFSTTQFESKEGIAEEDLFAIFSRYSPVELILPLNLYQDDDFIIKIKDISKCIIKEFQDYVFEYENGYSIIIKHFNLSNLESFDLENLQMAIQASGGLLAFLKETQRDVIPNIFQIKVIKQKEVLNLDYSTQRNLELLRNIRDRGKDATLFSIFNHTQTPMGGRLLAKIIVEPLINKDQINQRLEIVQKFKDDVFLRSDLRDKLEKMGDLERIINKLNFSRSANARDLLNLKNSLEVIPEIIDLLKKGKTPELESFLKEITDFSVIRDLIKNSIAENSPTTIKEGGIIKESYNETVDEYRNIINNGKSWMLKFEKSLKRRFAIQTGIKVSHNNILGYFIEITNTTKSKIRNFPEELISRQSIKNAVRYKSKELNEWEEKILTAEEKINDLEYQLFSEIREKVVMQTVDIGNVSESIAMIDVLCTFAEIAEKYNYCKPILRDDDRIIIKEGRHPIVEQINFSEPFIPNDCYMDTEKEQILIITGPNMAGKSTFLRQMALICLIAQMGSFVPAKSAQIGIIDRIFTRIGASDDLARRLSTFMIEMNETAKILNYSTPKSLIIIDELGRGTSTSDGGAIAIATLEKLHSMKVKTLFSTHFHQLTEIKLPRVKNYHLDIKEDEDGNITFIRKVQEGSTDKSYGIHIARLAGIPEDTIIRAFKVLEQIEKNDTFRETIRNGNNLMKLTPKLRKKEIKKTGKTVQTSFFKPIVKVKHEINEEYKRLFEIINNIDINNITPLKAIEKLSEIKKKIEDIESNDL